MNQNPNSQPQPQQQPMYHQSGIESQIKAMLSSTRGWIMFMGILHIVYASIYTLATLGIGIIVAWVPFLLGIFLINAATNIKNYLLLGDPNNLVAYHKQMKNFFVTMGVLTIIGIALTIIAVIVIVATGITLNTNGFNIPWG
ncbi:MAG: hypothetical protein C0592_14390 [Marinilabiliales bacterium]|nr:MAG: hypothetical protein C0592_14390 [Marinilabiliales bacterium]